MAEAILIGVAVAAGVIHAGVGIGVAADQVNFSLNQAAGENRQPGDKWNLSFNVSSAGSKMSSKSVKELLSPNVVTAKKIDSNMIWTLCSQHDDYKEMIPRNFIQSIHTNNPECGIKPNTWNATIHMDIFQAFGAPGHYGVHSGLRIAYQGLGEWFTTLSVDLQAIPEGNSGNDIGMSGIHTNICLENGLRVLKGIDDKVWEYKGSVTMSILELFETLADAMMKGHERGNYHLLNNNCVHFKNDVLSAIERKPTYRGNGGRKIPNKANEVEQEFELYFKKKDK